MDKWDERFLSLCKHISQWSKDPSTKLASVIVDPDRRIVSLGYNGFPKGVEDTKERYENREVKYPMIVHGEVNAVTFAKRDLSGCTIYIWPLFSCPTCTGIIIQSGIERVVAPINDNPRWKDSFDISKEMYAEAGVQVDLVDFETK